MQRATLVYNPIARTVPAYQRLAEATLYLREEGWEMELRTTEGPGHATLLAREAAASGSDVVFACGGDGTINEVANGLCGTPSALGLVRGGMGNVLAKELRVPRRPEDALRVLLDGRLQRFDLGVAGGRYFLAMAGVGFDAEVVRSVPPATKRVLGSTSYALWGAPRVLGHVSQPVSLRVDGLAREMDLFWLLLGNTRSYGGVVDIASRALADDGLLDAYIFSGRRRSWVIRTALRLALRRHHGADGVSFWRTREVEVLTPGLPVQADGEYLGETPMSFGIVPAAITLLVPSGGGANLFSQSLVDALKQD